MICSPFELERARVFKQVNYEFRRNLAPDEVLIAVSEALDDWLLATYKGAIRASVTEQAYTQTAARNKCLKLLRHQLHEEAFSHISFDAAYDNKEWEPSNDTGISEADEQKEFVSVLLSRLPKAWAQFLRLHYLEGYSVEEIGAKMGKSIKAVYHIKERAEERCREIGSKYFGITPPPPENDANLILKLILKKVEIEWGISGRIGVFPINAGLNLPRLTTSHHRRTIL